MPFVSETPYSFENQLLSKDDNVDDMLRRVLIWEYNTLVTQNNITCTTIVTKE